jgi:ABC-type Zn uptake system ZnuABC Zn-binding protein ZnuA
MRLALLVIALLISCVSAVEPLKVCASVPDLGSLCQRVGGEHIQLTVFAQGGDDEHHVEVRPSFVTALAQADVLVYMGLDMEIEWLPPIEQQVANPKLRWGVPGNINASGAITQLIKPDGAAPDAHGHVHALGNPHFLTDPVNGWLVAKRLCERFSALQPESAEFFAAGLATFSHDLAERLVGPAITKALGADEVLERCLAGTISKTPPAPIAGWLGRVSNLHGKQVVCDHDQWLYFARRFGFTCAAYLESDPGIPATAKHLARLVTTMKAADIRLIITSPVYDRKPAEVIAEQTQAHIAVLPHHSGAVHGTEDYLDFIEACVNGLESALKP